MKITAPYRGRSASKRLDMTDMKRALGVDGIKLWCAIAIVQAPQGEQHFEVLADDVHVEVVTQPSLIPLTCRLAAGIWRIPDVGEEVVVLIPEGEIAFMPILVDVLSSGSVPTTQGPAIATSVIARPHVLIHDGTGGAAALAKLSSLQTTIDKLNDVIDKLLTHTHSGVTTGAGASGPPVGLVEAHAPAAVGTTVLEAK